VSALLHDGGERWVEGVGETDVRDHSSFKESEGPDTLCAIYDLIRDDEISWLNRFLQASDGGESYDGSYSQMSQGGDVGAGGYLVGRKFVVQAMAGDEGYGDWFSCGWGGMVEDGDRGGRRAPGGCGCEGRDVGEVCEVLQAGAADYCYMNGI